MRIINIEWISQYKYLICLDMEYIRSYMITSIEMGNDDFMLEKTKAFR